MKYIVKLNYESFSFDDSGSAITFAEIAKRNYKKRKPEAENIDVTIYIEDDEKEE